MGRLHPGCHLHVCLHVSHARDGVEPTIIKKKERQLKWGEIPRRSHYLSLSRQCSQRIKRNLSVYFSRNQVSYSRGSGIIRWSHESVGRDHTRSRNSIMKLELALRTRLHFSNQRHRSQPQRLLHCEVNPVLRRRNKMLNLIYMRSFSYSLCRKSII